jgi:hypothetical protein
LLTTVQCAYVQDQWESLEDEKLDGMNVLEEDEYRRSGHTDGMEWPKELIN